MVRPATAADRGWVAKVLRTRWGGTQMALRGKLIDALRLPALIAEDEGRRCGLATYELRKQECEIITLDALELHRGIGTALVDAVAELATASGARRLVVVTTNDNLDALRFYQRRGFALAVLRPGAIEQSRKLKPVIAATGHHGIPLRDELELVRRL